MKKTQLIINVILIAGLVVLFVLFFTKNTDSSSKDNISETKTDSLKLDNIEKSKDIAYINVDTLLRNYKFYDELEARLLNKQKKLESQLNSKMAN